MRRNRDLVPTGAVGPLDPNSATDTVCPNRVVMPGNRTEIPAKQAGPFVTGGVLWQIGGHAWPDEARNLLSIWYRFGYKRTCSRAS
jgi:hypothetical protein